jgi:hypothetical protein
MRIALPGSGGDVLLLHLLDGAVLDLFQSSPDLRRRSLDDVAEAIRVGEIGEKKTPIAIVFGCGNEQDALICRWRAVGVGGSDF